MKYNITLQEGLNSIEVFDGRKFTYRFTPAIYSRGAPLLILASARGTKVPSKFSRKNWNVLSVVDTFGRKGDMSAYLGEKGNFFIKELLYELVQAAIKKCECIPKKNLYFYASSIASGAGIGQGILSDARAVYLNSPIIRVHDTTMYKSKYMECDKNIDYVIPPHMKNVIEADGVRFLKAHTHKKLPTFFVCDSLHQSEPWLQNFLEEHTYYFVNACKEEEVEVHLELMDTDGHKVHHTMKEVIELFDKYVKPQYLDLMHVSVALHRDILSVDCILGIDYPLKKDPVFAFYLMYKGERKYFRGYEDNNKMEFILDKEIDIKDVEVIAFVKDKDGIKLSEKICM